MQKLLKNVLVFFFFWKRRVFGTWLFFLVFKFESWTKNLDTNRFALKFL